MNNEDGIILGGIGQNYYHRYNTIVKNNFLDNERDAFFRNSRFISNFISNRWNQNYWNRPRIFPKLIFGKIRTSSTYIPHILWINIDWNPAKEPYDIGV